MIEKDKLEDGVYSTDEIIDEIEKLQAREKRLIEALEWFLLEDTYCYCNDFTCEYCKAEHLVKKIKEE